jgi:Universal stress protein family
MNDPIDRVASGDTTANAVPANNASELEEAAASEEVAPRRRLRQSYEAGHRPKFLVLVDDTEYCAKAVYYASRRAARVGAKVLLLRVIEPPPRELTMLMRIEAEEEAQQLLDRSTWLSQSIAVEPPETLIREGEDMLAVIFGQ